MTSTLAPSGRYSERTDRHEAGSSQLPADAPVLDEIACPVAAARLLASQTVRYAPGDYILYRVSLTPVDPGSDDQLLVVTININAIHPNSVVLRGPRAPWDRWTAARWRSVQLPEAWYPGLIALLAALGWADRPPVFDQGASHDFEL